MYQCPVMCSKDVWMICCADMHSTCCAAQRSLFPIKGMDARAPPASRRAVRGRTQHGRPGARGGQLAVHVHPLDDRDDQRHRGAEADDGVHGDVLSRRHPGRVRFRAGGTAA